MNVMNDIGNFSGELNEGESNYSGGDVMSQINVLENSGENCVTEVKTSENLPCNPGGVDATNTGGNDMNDMELNESLSNNISINHHEEVAGNRVDRLPGHPQEEDIEKNSMDCHIGGNFFAKMHGNIKWLYYKGQVKGRGGTKMIETRICQYLYILGKVRTASGKGWAYLVRFLDDDGREHISLIPLSLLKRNRSECIAMLADEGLKLEPGVQSAMLLEKYLHSVDSKERLIHATQVGWLINQERELIAYVFPSEIIYAKDEPQERIYFQWQGPVDAYREQGTLEEWQENIAALALGNDRLKFALALGLVPPLLEPLGMESGCFNFFGPSSIGKTTALVLVASEWGSGGKVGGILRTMRATGNGLESVAAQHNDSVVILDELGQADDKFISVLTYSMSNGVGKSRSRCDGTAQIVQYWRIIALISGEIPIEVKIQEGGGKVRAGQLVRVVDIPADADAGMGIFEDVHGYQDPSAFASALQEAARRYYGTASRAFIRKFLETGPQQFEAAWLKYKGEHLKQLTGSSASGQTIRVAERFLLCAFAGEKAIEWGILPWPRGEAAKAVKVCFQAWLTYRGGRCQMEHMQIIAQFLSLIEHHGKIRFDEYDIINEESLEYGWVHRAASNRMGYRTTDAKTGQVAYVIWPKSFQELYPNSVYAARVLRDAGFLITDRKGRLQVQVLPPDYNGSGPKIRGYKLVIPDDPDEGESGTDYSV